MNEVVLKFKKGNKIHIKESLKGSFTRWCGGNVTSECILRGKNSSNPKIRKKATFADNARHFKHRLGGSIVEAFKLRRLIARKWKHKDGGIIKADEGSKLTFGLKVKNVFNSDWGLFLTSAVSNISSAELLNNYLFSQGNLFKALNEEKYTDLIQQLLSQFKLDLKNRYDKWVLDYQAGLTNDKPSLLVAQHEAYLQAAPYISSMENNLRRLNDVIDLLINNLKTNTWMSIIGGTLQSGIGLLANKKLATSI